MKKHKNAKAILIIMTAIIFGFLLSACSGADSPGSDEGANADKPVTGTCVITIQDFCDNQKMDIHEGDTVYDILRATGVPVAAKEKATGLDIKAINGVEAGSDGATSGWMYYVNDEMPMDFCNKLQVSDGDIIVWSFEKGM